MTSHRDLWYWSWMILSALFAGRAIAAAWWLEWSTVGYAVGSMLAVWVAHRYEDDRP